MKQAVIDIGSNSMRLTVYETTPPQIFRVLFKEKIMAGLAGYVEHNGRPAAAPPPDILSDWLPPPSLLPA